ncbi:MAG: Fis family transcriptional regulator [Verrucomicrobia bacterium]|nr:MAG: Fis family transcriptional regulator [Verrucomicrobiota bacterium]
MFNFPDPRFSSIIFEHIPHGIFTVDKEGTITSFNRAAEKITGWSRLEVIGTQCAKVFRSDHCEHSCFLRQSIERGEQHRDQEVVITRKDGNELLISVSTANLEDENGRLVGGVEMFRDLTVIAELRRQIQSSYTSQDIISKSAAMRGVRELVPLVARSRSTVLVEGEPGTGKELVARAIHNLGPRRDQPFVAVNCGALPDSLAESELFGYVKGAFTDAVKNKPGRFALAEGGTLFLDEVGEISPAMQIKLLRVLQEREYMPLGGVAPVPADVRVLAATNRNLASEVSYGKFRQDLFYRLNIVRINLPPLRARFEDVPLLVARFIEKFNALQGRRITSISERAMAQLLRHDYPGNVRELENAIEHGFVVCGGSVIEREDLPPHIIGEQVAPLGLPDTATGTDMGPLQGAEALTIREALANHHGIRTLAAKELGISRNTLWRKMKRYEID